MLTDPGSVEGTFVGIVSHTYAAAGSYDVTVSAFSAEANPTPAHATALMASPVNPVTIHETNPYFHPSERTGSETSLPAAFALTVTLEGVAVCGADGAPCTSDGNVCTDDVCRENVCVHEPVTPGTACGSDASSECDAPDSCDESGI